MGIKALSGEVSHMSESTHTSGTTGNSSIGQGKISSKQVYSFRVKGKPVTCASKNAFSIGDGDFVACAGPEKNGVIDAKIIRNDTTGVTYGGNVTEQFVWTTILLLLSIGAIFTYIGALIGVPVFFVCLYLYYLTYQTSESKKALLSQVVET